MRHPHRCLFEYFIAMREKIPIQVQLAVNEERDFRRALSRDGLGRVENALAGIDVSHARASFEADRQMILKQIQRETTLADFNAFVQAGLRDEYRRVATTAAMQ